MKRSLLFLLILVVAVTVLAACGGDGDTTHQTTASITTDTPVVTTTSVTTTTPETTKVHVHIDYAATVVPGDDSVSVKQVVKDVKSYIDGDTTHFNVKELVNGKDVVKARYLAVNTPESTGKIEEWGKAASKFTKETLMKATSIMIESDTLNWDLDSTGDRCLLWIWYKTEENAPWRNLNIELLQNGLAIASNSNNNRYGSVCMDAITQAKVEKLHIYSGEKDPGFFYGDAVELTLKELRRNIEQYADVKVAFTGIVTLDSNNGVYVESYDAETDMYYGIYVYYGFNLSAKGLEILSEGNEVRIVGTAQFYETGGTWQVAGVSCNAFKPNDPNNLVLISEGNKPGYQEVTATDFLEKKVVFEREDGSTYSKDYSALAMDTSISMKNLVVKRIYTTQSENDTSNGAMTLTCEVDGKTITVRTNVLFDADGKKVTEAAFAGKTVDVEGVVGYFNGDYQIKVVALDGISVH
ncbi:MAG: thermonuclease family protein [Clostridia bacterium]|nr:thermonuclease family protein [Clostridia bacterium]